MRLWEGVEKRDRKREKEKMNIVSCQLVSQADGLKAEIYSHKNESNNNN